MPQRKVILAFMKIAKYLDDTGIAAVGRIDEQTLVPLDLKAKGLQRLSDLLDEPNPSETIRSLPSGTPIPLANVSWLPPIDDQEVWAAGVTYRRSQTARMEESTAAASCYDRVYTADRPELFFKATASRVRGHQQPLRIRSDATWNVPEPEITLVLSSQLKIVGYTIGNDMSSRDIEGENPLYLPQAKCYDASAGLGPWLTITDELPQGEDLWVRLAVERQQKTVFEGRTSAAELARGFEDLVSWLGRDNSFPNGAFLMTGTGIVPDSSFTLNVDDVVHISINGVGTLSNSIIQG